MKLQEIQTCRCTSQVHIPFSICWSEDNYIAMASDKGIDTVGGRWRARDWVWAVMLVVLVMVGSSAANDITSAVFKDPGSKVPPPAAFGDFNSDEYPDLFVISGNTIEILLGGDGEPMIKPASDRLKCKFPNRVTSIVPGDFDGDAIMDVLVTLDSSAKMAECPAGHVQEVKILWGSGDSLLCNASYSKPLVICGQPLAMDWNRDMIIDLFGVQDDSPTFWVFGTNRGFPTVEKVTSNRPLPELRIPHSHAFLDLNGDYNPDMFLTTKNGFEEWLKEPTVVEGFNYAKRKEYRIPEGVHKYGQSIFMDTELKGKLDHIFPACYDVECKNSSIFVRVNDKWLDLRVNFHDKTNKPWGFVPPVASSIIQNVITLHGGDYNMDGFPDLLATMRSGATMKTFLLKNEQCVAGAECSEYGRTFTIDWDALSPHNNNTKMGVFYDFGQDGILDIIFAKVSGGVLIFKNNLDYDANFIKVMVITNRKDQKKRILPDPITRKNRTFGTNLPGPLISYNSTNQDDQARQSVCPQLPQSAYMSLNLPYTLFGLGRTPNYVDKVTVGVYGETRDWPQIIPNSQMVVIPYPLDNPARWLARLFVTPSKLIVQSFIALLGTCLLLMLIVAALWWKERREDHQERRQESHRFHFDGL